jgi:hypothetical protein
MTHPGPPVINDVNTIPTGQTTPELLSIYNNGQYDRTNPKLNPNIVLWNALEGKNVKQTTKFEVSTANPGGAVTNISFEKKKANVSQFHTTFWLSELEDGSSMLQYSQTMEMEFEANPGVTFYHIDAATMFSAK